MRVADGELRIFSFTQPCSGGLPCWGSCISEPVKPHTCSTPHTHTHTQTLANTAPTPPPPFQPPVNVTQLAVDPALSRVAIEAGYYHAAAANVTANVRWHGALVGCTGLARCAELRSDTGAAALCYCTPLCSIASICAVENAGIGELPATNSILNSILIAAASPSSPPDHFWLVLVQGPPGRQRGGRAVFGGGRARLDFPGEW